MAKKYILMLTGFVLHDLHINYYKFIDTVTKIIPRENLLVYSIQQNDFFIFRDRIVKFEQKHH